MSSGPKPTCDVCGERLVGAESLVHEQKCRGRTRASFGLGCCVCGRKAVYLRPKCETCDAENVELLDEIQTLRDLRDAAIDFERSPFTSDDAESAFQRLLRATRALTPPEMGRPNYVKCVRHDRTAVTWCGREIEPAEWTFVGLDHAAGNAHTSGRLIACPACAAAAMTALAPPASETGEVHK